MKASEVRAVALDIQADLTAVERKRKTQAELVQVLTA